MAVRNASSRSRRIQPDETAVGSPPSDAAVSPRIRLLPAMIAFALWVSGLITLAVVSANPTTLNRAQIRVAPLIVEATLIEGERPEWRVTHSWPEGQVEGTITIEGLEALKANAGSPYLIPVRPVRDGHYSLVLSPKPFVAPFIYPSNPKTVAALEEILREPPPQS